MKRLFLITARGGSKGIPKKNTKLFNGKPLIQYSIELALKFANPKDICISTDDLEIISLAEKLGVNVPFVRPDELATDTASSYDVVLHALKYYEEHNVYYDQLVLLQPTSPLRTAQQLSDCLSLMNSSLDMLVSVKEVEDPSYLILHENTDGYLTKKYPSAITRRQDAEKVYVYNGAIYIYNCNSLKKHSPIHFTKVKKYVMDAYTSIDIDHPLDWELALLVASNKISN
jgi:N-acylneuraminate cytidylyltransferase